MHNFSHVGHVIVLLVFRPMVIPCITDLLLTPPHMTLGFPHFNRCFPRLRGPGSHLAPAGLEFDAEKRTSHPSSSHGTRLTHFFSCSSEPEANRSWPGWRLWPWSAPRARRGTSLSLFPLPLSFSPSLPSPLSLPLSPFPSLPLSLRFASMPLVGPFAGAGHGLRHLRAALRSGLRPGGAPGPERAAPASGDPGDTRSDTSETSETSFKEP